MIGISAAARFPKAFASLTVCSALADMPDAFGAEWRARAKLVDTLSVAAIIDSTVERWFTPAFAQRAPLALAATRDMISATSTKGYVGAVDVIHAIRLSPLLPAITIPTLFMVGAEDSASTPDIMRGLQERVPGSRFVAIADAAHLPTIEQPAQVSDALRGFISPLQT